MEKTKIQDNVSKIPIIRGKAEHLKNEEWRLGIPDEIHNDWYEAKIISVAGCFRERGSERVIDFGGFLKVLLDGRCRGEIIDGWGAAAAVGRFTEDNSLLELSKTYVALFSKPGQMGPNTVFELTKDTEPIYGREVYKGTWYYNNYSWSHCEAICIIERTNISSSKFCGILHQAYSEGRLDERFYKRKPWVK